MFLDPNKNVIIALEMWGTIIGLVFMVTIVIIGKVNRRMNRRIAGLELIVSTLLLTHAFFMILDGTTVPILVGLLHISIILRMGFCYFAVCEFNAYLWTTIRKDCDKRIYYWVLAVYVINTIEILLLVLSVRYHFYYYLDAQNHLQYGPLFVLSPALAFLSMLIELGIVIWYRSQWEKNGLFLHLFYLIIPIIGGVLEFFFPQFPFVNFFLFVDGIVMFMGTQQSTSRYFEEQQQKLFESQIDILRSQIGPHFLFNCLSTIKYLCKKDPKQASEAVVDLSFFLRTNLDALDRKTCIPFEKELEHTQNYIALEMRRFIDKIHVEYDLQEHTFLLPPLTIQPLVENAIKHGISKKEEGGTIWISSRRIGNQIRVVIRDDGVGFEPAQKKEDGHAHLGMANVQERLKLMCKGHIEVKSKPGKGTEVTVVVPVGGDSNGYISS